MNKQIKAVLFDLDGTLLDTRKGIIHALKYTMKQKGYQIPSEEILHTFIGPPIQDSLQKMYHIEGKELEEAVSIFREQYKTQYLLEATPYEGIYELLNELQTRGILIGVATYKREDYALQLLRHYGFHEYTEFMYGADFHNILRKADIMKKCIFEMEITQYDNILMVGDSDNDAIASEQLGVPFVGALYGFDFKTKNDVSKFEHVGTIKKPLDLLQIIEV